MCDEITQNILQNLESYIGSGNLVLLERHAKEHGKKKSVAISALTGGATDTGPTYSMKFMYSTERHPFWLQVLKMMLIQTAYPKSYELFESYVSRTAGCGLLTSTYQKYPPKYCSVISKKQWNGSSAICLFKMLTTLKINRNKVENKQIVTNAAKSGNKNYVLLDQHDHMWSKNKRILSILMFSIFVVLSAVVIKIAIVKKEKPQSKKEKELATMIYIMK